jgi:hypothetical protein
VSNMAEKLTPEQVDECKEIFDLFDADEDGKSPSHRTPIHRPPRAHLAPSLTQLICACVLLCCSRPVGLQVASPRVSS